MVDRTASAAWRRDAAAQVDAASLSALAALPATGGINLRHGVAENGFDGKMGVSRYNIVAPAL